MIVVDRFHPQRRRERQTAIDAGQLHKLDELALLEPEQIRPLALLSLGMFGAGAIFFVALNLAAYSWQRNTLSIQGAAWSIVLWLILNIVGYIVILPIHEAVHACMFLLWGGKPYFGAKLPLALYCGAKEQLFARNDYLVVGLAPLIVITLAGIILTLLAPGLASYTLLATIGNFAGAAGDVWVARRLWCLPADTLVEDTETGYRAWEVAVS